MERHELTVVLDLSTFDEGPFAGTIEAAQRAGFRFFSLADLPDAEAGLRALHALNARTAADVPGTEDAFPPFERYREQVLESRGQYRPEGQIVAALGDEWVGLASISYSPGDKSAYNAHTGVVRAYRGRGLAQALKLLAIRTARAWGAERLRTENDEHNAPMLAINRKLGYRPEPGWYRVKGPLA